MSEAAQASEFEEDMLQQERSESEQLLLYLEGFDGPIDMLLNLARDQKVDLAKISILALANQYLDFIEKARAVRLELAADYLVMAAWLAYLKSRLLVPQEEKKEEEPSAQELADALQFQLRRLEAMRKVANALFNLPRLGFNVFGRGQPDGLRTTYKPVYEMTYYDLLSAYGDIQQRQDKSVYQLKAVRLFTMEESIERLTNMLGKIPRQWVSLFMFLPTGLDEKIVKRSAVASTFGASLELVKRGALKIQQEKNYAPIYIRKPEEGEDEKGVVSTSEETTFTEGGVDVNALAEVEMEQIAAEDAATAVRNGEEAIEDGAVPEEQDRTTIEKEG